MSGRRNIIFNSLLGGDDSPFVPVYSDWYLPSKDELEEMRVQLFLYGIGDLVAGGSVYRWSSSEHSDTRAWASYFAGVDGAFNIRKDDSGGMARAIRTITTETVYNVRDVGPSGGWIFYKDGNTYLECAPADPILYGIMAWSNITSSLVEGTGTAVGMGLANTLAIIAQAGHTNSAAKLCNDYVP